MLSLHIISVICILPDFSEKKKKKGINFILIIFFFLKDTTKESNVRAAHLMW